MVRKMLLGSVLSMLFCITILSLDGVSITDFVSLQLITWPSNVNPFLKYILTLLFSEINQSSKESKIESSKPILLRDWKSCWYIGKSSLLRSNIAILAKARSPYVFIFNCKDAISLIMCSGNPVERVIFCCFLKIDLNLLHSLGEKK